MLGERDQNRGASIGVHSRVGEQVGDHLAQTRFVADRLEGFVGQVEGPDVIAAGGVGIADGVDEQHGEIHRLHVELAALVEAGEQQQVFDQPRHAHRLRLDPAECVHRVGRQFLAAAPGEFGVAPNGGQRRAQFVARVGDELAHFALAGLPRFQGAVDMVEHAVERRADPAHFGTRVGVPRRNPIIEGHLAAVEGQLRHPSGRRCHALEGTQGQPHHPGGNDGDHDKPRERDQANDHSQLGCGGRHSGQGQTDQIERAGAGRIDLHPIVTELTAEIDGYWRQLVDVVGEKLHLLGGERFDHAAAVVGIAGRDGGFIVNQREQTGRLGGSTENTVGCRRAKVAAPRKVTGTIAVVVTDTAKRNARSVNGGGQLHVEAIKQGGAQNNHAHHADRDAHEREQPDHGEHETPLQSPGRAESVEAARHPLLGHTVLSM